MTCKENDAGLGGRIRAARYSLGWKQAYLAVRLGVSQTTIAKWESGVRTPSVAMQKKLKDLIWRGNPVDRMAALIAVDFGYSGIVRGRDSRVLLVSNGMRQVCPEHYEGQFAVDYVTEKTRTVIHRCWADFGADLKGLLGVNYLSETKDFKLASSWQVLQGRGEAYLSVRDSLLEGSVNVDGEAKFVTVDDVCDYRLEV